MPLPGLWLRPLLKQRVRVSQAAPLTVEDPCFHPGYQDPKNYSAVYGSPCVSARLPPSAPVSFSHRGTGNFAQCQKMVRSIFNFSSCSYSRCSFNGVFQPRLQGKFGVKEQEFILTDHVDIC